jgi:hypothetical protein
MYVYSLQPLRVLRCDLIEGLGNDIDKEAGRRAVCKVIFGGPAVSTTDQTGNLRCGTNWIEYQQGLYVSIGRTRLGNPKPCSNSIYRPHLLLLDLRDELQARIRYVSEPIVFMDKILFTLYSKALGKVVNRICYRHAVLTPGSLTRLSDDSVDLAISINDDVNAIVRLGRFESTISDIISSIDLSNENDAIANSDLQMRKYILKNFTNPKTNSGYEENPILWESLPDAE